MKSLLPVGLAFLLCALALGGLWLHNRSLGLTEQVQALEVRHRDLAQQACSLQAEVNRMAGYSRLESLWVVAGRPAAADTLAWVAGLPVPDSGAAEADSDSVVRRTLAVGSHSEAGAN